MPIISRLSTISKQKKKKNYLIDLHHIILNIFENVYTNLKTEIDKDDNLLFTGKENNDLYILRLIIFKLLVCSKRIPNVFSFIVTSNII